MVWWLAHGARLPRRHSTILALILSVAAAAVAAILIWQGLSEHGAPDPLRPNTSPTVAFLDIGVLVFREGLECILVLAAITASMTGAKQAHRRPVALGAGVAFGATLVTWLIAVRIVGSLSDNVPALDLQAATGLLAVIVLLVIMNWFFHKIYWGGWIRAHNRRRKSLLATDPAKKNGHSRLWWGLVLLGFTSLYREGFEVVLFLQSYNLRLGGGVVLKAPSSVSCFRAWWRCSRSCCNSGCRIGRCSSPPAFFSAWCLLVMVGEQAQEMQLAHWISRTEIPAARQPASGWERVRGFPDLRNADRAGLAAVRVVRILMFAACDAGRNDRSKSRAVPLLSGGSRPIL